MKKASPADDVAVFTEAVRLPEGDRGAFLDRVCAGDAALRQRVEGLLRAHEQAGGFLEEEPWIHAAAEVAGAVIGEKPGDRIGRYRLLQQIGEGGGGVVFMAEQEEPVRRRVALKIIKPGMDTRTVIARFEAERQALALMDHPNIAKVFDAGATDSGRPFFVMELIRGLRITDHCDRNALSTAQRLALFVEVCQAVQHAHQKGIIHRDLKPSNVLVTTTEEGSALPVVIDFGIAKAAGNQRLTDKTYFTAFEMLIGTPAYMSPEQAELTNVDVDTRTDIYSLGVLLYELLTGAPPFDSRQLQGAGLDEIRRVIREKNPVRPSTRLSTMAAADLVEVARFRCSEPPQLLRLVRGDLDWIVMKALEKDRTRRYETANGLALDVKRLLAHETVSARPPSRLYQFRKAIQRHKVITASAGLVLSLGVTSLVVVAAALNQEHRARLKAQTEESRSRQVTRLLKSMLEGVGPSVARGRNTELLRDILDRTADGLGRQSDAQPAVEAEMRGLLGRVYFDIGNYARAEEMAQEAVRLRRMTAGPKSREAAAALSGLGLALWKQRKLVEAEAAHEEALRIRRGLLGVAHPEVAESLDQLGCVYRRQRRLVDAESLTREGLQIRRAAFGSEHLDIAESLRNLSIILCDLGRKSEAEVAAREVLAMRRRLLGEDHPLVASALADLAWVLGRESTESESLEAEAFGVQHRILGDEHPDLAKSIYAQGERLRQQGKLAESHAILQAALSIQRKLLGSEHPDVLATLSGLGVTLELEGRWQEASVAYREAAGLRRRLSPGADASGLPEVEALARVLMAEGNLAESEAVLDEALVPPVSGKPASVALLKWRVDLLGRQARWAEARADAEVLVELQPSEHYYFHTLAPLLLVTGDQAGYRRLCQRMLSSFASTENAYVAERMAKDCLLLPETRADLGAIDLLAAKSLGPEGWTTAMPYSEVAVALCRYRQGRFVEAVDWARRPLTHADIPARTHAHAVLAMAQMRLGELDQARELLAQGRALSAGLQPGRDAATIGGAWLSWLFGRLLLDEAERFIPPASKPAQAGNRP